MYRQSSSFAALARRPLFRPTRLLLSSKSLSSPDTPNQHTHTNEAEAKATTHNASLSSSSSSLSSSFSSPSSAQAVMSLLEKIAQRGRQGSGVGSQASVLRQRHREEQQGGRGRGRSRGGRQSLHTGREHGSRMKQSSAARRTAFSPASLFEVQRPSRVVRSADMGSQRADFTRVAARPVHTNTHEEDESIGHEHDASCGPAQPTTPHTPPHTLDSPTPISSSLLQKLYNTVTRKALPWTAMLAAHPTLRQLPLYGEKTYWTRYYCRLHAATPLHRTPTHTNTTTSASDGNECVCDVPPVLLCTAPTGAGKSVLVPFFLLEAHWQCLATRLRATMAQGTTNNTELPAENEDTNTTTNTDRTTSTSSPQSTHAASAVPFALHTQEAFVADFAACSRVCVVVSQPTRLACLELARFAASLLACKDSTKKDEHDEKMNTGNIIAAAPEEREEREEGEDDVNALLGQRVGYAVSGEAVFSAATELIFATPGYILSALQASAHNAPASKSSTSASSSSSPPSSAVANKTLRSEGARQLRPTTLVVDEAHCRNLETDLLLAWVKQYRVHAAHGRNKRSKQEGEEEEEEEAAKVSRLRQIVVMSATMHKAGMMRYLQLPVPASTNNNSEGMQGVYYMADREERRRLASSAMMKHTKTWSAASTTPAQSVARDTAAAAAAGSDAPHTAQREAEDPPSLARTLQQQQRQKQLYEAAEEEQEHEQHEAEQLLRTTQLQSGPFLIERYFLEDLQSGAFTQSHMLFQPWRHIPRDTTPSVARAKKLGLSSLSDERASPDLGSSFVNSNEGQTTTTTMMTNPNDNERLPLLLGPEGSQVIDTLGCFYRHNSLRSVLLYSQTPAFAVFLLYLLQVVDMRWGLNAAANRSKRRASVHDGLGGGDGFRARDATDEARYALHDTILSSTAARDDHYNSSKRDAPLGVLVFLPGFAEIQLVLQMLEQVCARSGSLTGVLSGRTRQNIHKQTQTQGQSITAAAAKRPMAAQHASSADRGSTTHKAHPSHNTLSTSSTVHTAFASDNFTTLSYNEMRFSVPILHAQAIGSPDEQLALSLRCNAPLRLILATSVAESSLTIPNVRLVVDCGLGRSFVADTLTETTQRRTRFVDVHTLRQRCGRAGRTCDGVVLHLVPRYFYETLAARSARPPASALPHQQLLSSAVQTGTHDTENKTASLAGSTSPLSPPSPPPTPWVEPLTESTSTILLRVKHLFSHPTPHTTPRKTQEGVYRGHFSLCASTSEMLASLPCPPSPAELQAAYTQLIDTELLQPALTAARGSHTSTQKEEPEEDVTNNDATIASPVYSRVLRHMVDESRLSGKGRVVAALPLPPELGLFLFHSFQFACVEDALLVACGMVVPSVFLAPRLATHSTNTANNTSSTNSAALACEMAALSPLEQYYKHLYIQRELAGFPLDRTTTETINNTSNKGTGGDVVHSHGVVPGRLSEPLVLHRILSRWYTASTREELHRLQAELNLNRSAMRTVDLAILQCCTRLVQMLQHDAGTTENTAEECAGDENTPAGESVLHETHVALLDPSWPPTYRAQLVKSLRRLRQAALERATQRVLTSFRGGLSQWYSADDQLMRLLTAHYTHQSIIALTQAEQQRSLTYTDLHASTHNETSSSTLTNEVQYNNKKSGTSTARNTFYDTSNLTRSQLEPAAEHGVWHHPTFALALRALERRQRSALFQNELYRSVRHSETELEVQTQTQTPMKRKKMKTKSSVAVVSPHVRAILRTRAVQGLTRRPYRFVFGALADRLCAAYIAGFARHTMRGEDSNGYRQHQKRLVRNVGVLQEDTSQVCTFNVDIRVALEAAVDKAEHTKRREDVKRSTSEASSRRTLYSSNNNNNNNSEMYARHVSRPRRMQPLVQLLNACQASPYAWLSAEALSPARIRAVLEPYMRGTGLVQLELFRTGRAAAVRFARPPFATLFTKVEHAEQDDEAGVQRNTNSEVTTQMKSMEEDLLAPKVIPPPADVFVGYAHRGQTPQQQQQRGTRSDAKSERGEGRDGDAALVQLAPFGVSLLAAAQAVLHHIPFILTRPTNTAITNEDDTGSKAELSYTATQPAHVTPLATTSPLPALRDVHRAMMNETKDEVQWCSTYGVMYRLRRHEVAALGFAHLFPPYIAPVQESNNSDNNNTNNSLVAHPAVQVNGYTYINTSNSSTTKGVAQRTGETSTSVHDTVPACVEAMLSISPPINISRGIQWRVNLPCSALRHATHTITSYSNGKDVSHVYSCELCNLICADAGHFAAHCAGLRHLEHLHYAVQHGLRRAQWLEVCGGAGVGALASLLYRNTETNTVGERSGPVVRSALYACRPSHLSFLNILRYNNNNTNNNTNNMNSSNAAPLAIAGSLLSSTVSALMSGQDVVQLPAGLGPSSASAMAAQQSTLAGINNNNTSNGNSAQVLSAHHVWVLDFDQPTARAVCHSCLPDSNQQGSASSAHANGELFTYSSESTLTLQVQPARVPAGLFVLAGYLTASTRQFATSLLLNASHTYVHAIMLYDWGVWRLPRPLRLSQLEVLQEVQRGGGWPGYVEWLDEPDITSLDEQEQEQEADNVRESNDDAGKKEDNASGAHEGTFVQRTRHRSRAYEALRAEMYSDLHWCVPTRECPECTFTGAMHTKPARQATYGRTTADVLREGANETHRATEAYVERERRYLTGAAMQPVVVRASIAQANKHTTNSAYAHAFGGTHKHTTGICGAQEVIAADATVAATLLLVLQEYMQAGRAAVSLTDYVERVVAKLELLQPQPQPQPRHTLPRNTTQIEAMQAEGCVQEQEGEGGSGAMQLLCRFLARRAPQRLEGLLRDLGCQFSAPPIALAQAVEAATAEDTNTHTSSSSSSSSAAAVQVSLPPSALMAERAATRMTFTLPPILPSLLPAPQFAALLRAHLQRARQPRRRGAVHEVQERSGYGKEEKEEEGDGSEEDEDGAGGGGDAALRF